MSGCGGAALIGTTAKAGDLSASQGLVSFGSVAVGQTASSNVSLLNSGAVAVQVTKVSVNGGSFSVSGLNDLPITIGAGSTYSVGVNFSPQATGTSGGQVAITSNTSSAGTLVIGLNGNGVTASSQPTLTTLSCANSSITGAGTDNCTVTLNAAAPAGGLAVGVASNNSAVTAPATVTVPATATSASFTATASSVSTSQTATLTASAGSVAETFALQLNAAEQGSTGAPTLSINATSLTFGNVNVNTTATQSATLSSTGTAAVTISAATVTGSGFTLSGTSFPLTLNPNQTATLNVQFDPAVAGSATGTLTVVSTSAANPITTVSLSGTGEAGTATAGSAQVTLTWDAPSSSPDPVAGYNVYRSPSGASSYVQLNTSIVTEATYVDSAAQGGQSYDYIVESVDASGITSAPTNIATVTIP